MDYSYKETKSALNNRIDSHKQFSNFSLHEWISQKFNIMSGQDILDLGCGNGNFTDLFKSKIGKEGTLVGVDKNEALVEQAKAKASNSTNIESIAVILTSLESRKNPLIGFSPFIRFITQKICDHFYWNYKRV